MNYNRQGPVDRPASGLATTRERLADILSASTDDHIAAISTAGEHLVRNVSPQWSKSKAAGPLSLELAILPAVLSQRAQQTRFFNRCSGGSCLHGIGEDKDSRVHLSRQTASALLS